jgi:hypothetical protein
MCTTGDSVAQLFLELLWYCLAYMCTIKTYQENFINHIDNEALALDDNKQDRTCAISVPTAYPLNITQAYSRQVIGVVQF